MRISTYFVGAAISPSESIFYLYEVEDKHIASDNYQRLRKHTLSHSVSQQIFSENPGCAQNCAHYWANSDQKLLWALPLWKAI